MRASCALLSSGSEVAIPNCDAAGDTGGSDEGALAGEYSADGDCVGDAVAE